MSAQATSDEISLTIRCGDPFAELFLVRSDYSLAARGIGELHASVQPGIFKIKTRVGRAENETIRLFEHDESIDVGAPVPASPIPLDKTSKTHEYQMSAAVAASARPGIRLGSGAEVFLMARRWTPQGAPALEQRENPAAAMKLLDASGKVVVDFGTAAALDPDPRHEPTATCTVALSPGPYVLRTRLRSGISADQTVYASRGWQLRIFVLADPAVETTQQPAGSEAVMDLSELGGMAVSLSRIGTPFNPYEPLAKDTELVRAALADGRAVFSPAARTLMEELLHGKFEDPMAGLYGAHLMLMGRAYDSRKHDEIGALLDPSSHAWVHDETLYDEVVQNLGTLLGEEHPDVQALSLRAGASVRRTTPLLVAPMLRASWLLYSDASNDDPGLVTLDLWERIARMIPAGPYLVWQPGGFETLTSPAKRSWSALPGAVVAAVGNALAAAIHRAPPRRSRALDVIDAAMPHEIRGSLSVDDRRTLAASLGVPRAAVDAVLDK